MHADLKLVLNLVVALRSRDASKLVMGGQVDNINLMLQGMRDLLSSEDKDNLLICISAWSCHPTYDVRLRCINHMSTACKMTGHTK